MMGEDIQADLDTLYEMDAAQKRWKRIQEREKVRQLSSSVPNRLFGVTINENGDAV